MGINCGGILRNLAHLEDVPGDYWKYYRGFFRKLGRFSFVDFLLDSHRVSSQILISAELRDYSVLAIYSLL